MSELSIRRERIIAERFDKMSKAEKRAGVAQGQSSTAKKANTVLTDGLLRQIGKMNRADRSAAGRQLLRTGDGALAEVKDSLSRMGKLAHEAANNPAADRSALQSELNDLLDKLEHIFKSASYGEIPLFQQDDKTANLPDWFLSGLSHTASGTELLNSLGLSSSASPSQIMAAIKNGLGNNAAADRLAVLCLGAVIAGGGDPAQSADLGSALEGLQRLLEKTAEGVSLDQAIYQLTNGAFTGLADFEAQFGDGSSQSLMDYLSDLLNSDFLSGELAALDMDLLAGLGGTDLDLLLEALGNSHVEDPAAALPVMQEQQEASVPLPDAQAQPAQQFGAVQASGQDLSGVSYQADSDTLLVKGSEQVTIRGAAPPLQEGQAAQGDNAPLAPELSRMVLSGSAPVTLQNAQVESLRIDTAAARLLSTGQNVLAEVQMQSGSSVELGGSGLLEIGRFVADSSNTITLSGGAVLVDGGNGRLGDDAALLQQEVTLLASQLHTVYTPEGVQAKPLDAILNALVPGWNSITSMTVDGKLVSDSLQRAASDPAMARLFLENGSNNGHGYPIHAFTIDGRDETDQVKTRYAWMRWDDRAEQFREIIMYPNPFIVTGGVKGEDWEYDDTTQTLCIYTNRVTGLEGGSGLDAEQVPFSGKVSLASHLEPIQLTLNGVTCRAASGRALDLGQDNEVTLFLGNGTVNTFASGMGCAGISLGDSTSLIIDREPGSEPEEEFSEEDPDADPDADPTLDALLSGDLDFLLDSALDAVLDNAYSDDLEDDAVFSDDPDEETQAHKEPAKPAGTLFAVGGNGGAGIGRDSGESRDRFSAITIRGGVISASGSGGGAGIGAGMYGFMGPISIIGGTVNAKGGEKGGAGIGGALGAPAGDIIIMGGVVSASAASNAAAIGAGIEGECGDILISGNARIVKAEGADAEAGIGACHLGGCGDIRISEDADIGDAAVKHPSVEPIPVQVGQDTVRIPRFVITPRMMRLKDLDLTSYINAQFAEKTVEDASKEVTLMQEKCSSMYSMLDRMADRERNERAAGAAHKPVRSSAAADVLLEGTKQSLLAESSQAVQAHGGHDTEEILKLLQG